MSGSRPARFLALGDSYTIGESVAESERWPVLLAARIRAHGVAIAEPEIIARTGWTTDELADGIREASPRGPYALVTLLIGVNDQYRELVIESYALGFAALLNQAIGFAGGDAARVVVLSIPDWGVTPFAAGCDRARIASELDAFNRVNAEAARLAGARCVDVTGCSRKAARDSSLIAPDGLHPSGRMYGAWADLALPAALEALGDAVR